MSAFVAMASEWPCCAMSHLLPVRSCCLLWETISFCCPAALCRLNIVWRSDCYIFILHHIMQYEKNCCLVNSGFSCPSITLYFYPKKSHSVVTNLWKPCNNYTIYFPMDTLVRPQRSSAHLLFTVVQSRNQLSIQMHNYGINYMGWQLPPPGECH